MVYCGLPLRCRGLRYFLVWMTWELVWWYLGFDFPTWNACQACVRPNTKHVQSTIHQTLLIQKSKENPEMDIFVLLRDFMCSNKACRTLSSISLPLLYYYNNSAARRSLNVTSRKYTHVKTQGWQFKISVQRFKFLTVRKRLCISLFMVDSRPAHTNDDSYTVLIITLILWE